MSFNVFTTTSEFLKKQNVPTHVQSQVESTNDLAKKEAFSLSDPIKIYFADQQTKGRGRDQNVWQNSPAGTGLAMTFSLAPQGAPQPITSPLVGLYVYEALKFAFPKADLSLKAPNDIYLGSKKLAGLLVEVSQMGESFRLIIGLGINVAAAPMSVPEATCLLQHGPVTQDDWFQFLNELIQKIRTVARSCLATHLSESERRGLLTALNRNPNITEELEQVSPFGDLVFKSGTKAWRTL